MNHTVLIVEDDPKIRRILCHIIQEGGATAMPAEDGEAALKYVRDVEVPVAIILDLMMPKMDGFQFLESLRADARSRYVPVIVCTALGDAETQVRLKALGVAEVVVKPKVDRRTVLTAVKRAMQATPSA